MTTLLALSIAGNAVLGLVLWFMCRAFLRELRGLLEVQDRLLDRVQAPEVAAQSAAVRLSPPRPSPPAGRIIRDRTGLVRIFVPSDKSEDVDEPAN